MLRKVMRGKIHRCVITQCDLDYVGSITIDADLLRVSGIVPNEAVQVLDIDNGARLETYVICGEAGTGIIGVNGAAARLVETGHRIIIVAYGLLAHDDLDDHSARVVVCNENNAIVEELRYDCRLPEPAINPSLP